MVLIEDCHISANSSYPIYEKGITEQQNNQGGDNTTNIYIKNPDGQTDFIGSCWPGLSVWIDYLNENA